MAFITGSGNLIAQSAVITVIGGIEPEYEYYSISSSYTEGDIIPYLSMYFSFDKRYAPSYTVIDLSDSLPDGLQFATLNSGESVFAIYNGTLSSESSGTYIFKAQLQTDYGIIDSVERVVQVQPYTVIGTGALISTNSVITAIGDAVLDAVKGTGALISANSSVTAILFYETSYFYTANIIQRIDYNVTVQDSLNYSVTIK